VHKVKSKNIPALIKNKKADQNNDQPYNKIGMLS